VGDRVIRRSPTTTTNPIANTDFLYDEHGRVILISYWRLSAAFSSAP
jgi:hypothetical protein